MIEQLKHSVDCSNPLSLLADLSILANLIPFLTYCDRAAREVQPLTLLR
uniref:Unannotated protein n=1 Tax=freshwater metagenome TaxID=449393 RepID=A0A6J5ZYR2_9ZZZZ